jgi:hypothetical protein
MEQLLQQGLVQLGASGIVLYVFMMYMRQKDKEMSARLKETEDWIRREMMGVINNNSILVAQLVEQMHGEHCPFTNTPKNVMGVQSKGVLSK